MESEKDKLLWKEAKKRVGFKNHLITYILVNIFFWVMWWLGDRGNSHNGLPWPIFPTIGWGFGLFWHFAGTYLRGDKVGAVEREFQKLKKREEQRNS